MIQSLLSIVNINDVESPSFDQPRQKNVSDCENDSETAPSSIDNDDNTSKNSVSSSSKYYQRQKQYRPFCVEPEPLRQHNWSEPAAEDYNVRGKSYVDDKIKQPSDSSAFTLLAVDLIKTDITRPISTGVCEHPDERLQRALARERKLGIDTTVDSSLPEFVFAVNLVVPADDDGFYYNAVFYFGVNKYLMEEINTGSTPFGNVMNRYIFGDSDDYRNGTLKLIPRVIEGNFFLRKAVGTRPAILGKEMKQYYAKGNRYFEVIVDISSNEIAKRITQLCLGYIDTLVVDLMFVVEGNDELTLPERIFGGTRINKLDFQKLRKIGEQSFSYSK